MPHDVAARPDSLKLHFDSPTGDWLWSLRHGPAEARGQSPSLEAALRDGAFTAAALAALERIGRRRF